MKIKVVATREKEPDFVSRQIMAKDSVQYSHVLIAFDDKIFHAIGKGVCVQDAAPYFESHEAVESFDLELEVSRDYFMGFVRGSCGKEYSQSQIAALAIGRVENNGDEKMICSELVGLVMNMGGIKLSGDQDSWRPIHCIEALRARS